MENQIKTFEDACKALSIPTTLPQVDALPEKHRKAIVANYQLYVIAQALNEGWEPNWNDFSERKYYPWFDMETYGDAPVGSGFSFLGYDCDYTNTFVGSRLCFKSRELAEYAGKQFESIYKDVYLIEK